MPAFAKQNNKTKGKRTMSKSSICGRKNVNEILNKIIMWGSGTAVIFLSVSFRSAFSAVLCLSLSLFLLFLLLRRIKESFTASLFSTSYLTAAVILSAIVGKRFFDCWKNAYIIGVLAARIGTTSTGLVMPLTLIGCAASIPFLAYISACIYRHLNARYAKDMETLSQHFEKCSLGRAAVILFLVYFIALFPVIRANYNYIDDSGRVFSGYAGWDDFSRYLSNFLSSFIHCEDYLSDISPLPQIIAMLVLVLASVVVVRVFKGSGRRISLWDLISVLPLGLSPYFLENISYKFDAPYMALSVLASVVPLLFCEKKRLVYIGTVFLGILVVCMTYQAASGIFPMAVILLAFQKWCKKEKQGREILTFVFDSVIAYVAALGIFSLFLMKPVDDYVSNDIASISNIFSNYQRYLSLVKSDFHPLWGVLVLALVIWYIAMSVSNSKQSKAITFFLSVFVTIFSALLSFGIYPALAAPLTAPRAMYGVGAFIAFMGVGNIAEKDKRLPLRVVTIMIAWVFMTFAATYGNALAAQQEYEDFRREEVLSDLSDLEEFYGSDAIKTVQINGSVGYAPAIRETVSQYGILQRLVPIQFREKWSWGLQKFRDYYGLSEEIICNSGQYLEGYSDWPVLQETFYHTIYNIGNYFVIELK